MTIYQTHPLAALYIAVGVGDGDDDDDDDDVIDRVVDNDENDDDIDDKYDDDDERNVWGEGGIARLNQKPTVLSLSQ